jgi:hypothetical protein
LRIDRRVHPGDPASNPAGIRNANGAAIKSAKYDNVMPASGPLNSSVPLDFLIPYLPELLPNSPIVVN